MKLYPLLGEAASPDDVDVEPASNSALMEIFAPMIDSFLLTWNDALKFAPKLIMPIVVFVLGLIFAKVIRFMVRGIAKRIALDSAAEKMGIKQLLARASIRASIPSIMGTVAYLLVMLFVIKMVVHFLDIEDVSNALNAVIAFLPRVLVAIIILMAGLLVGDLLKNVIRRGMEGFGIDYAIVISNLIYGLVFVMTLTVVLGHLLIQTELLNDTVKILVGGLTLALAISLGLGLKAIAHEVVSGVYARDVFEVGAEVQIEGKSGKVDSFHPTSVKLRTEDGGFLVVPNSKLMGSVISGKKADES